MTGSCAEKLLVQFSSCLGSPRGRGALLGAAAFVTVFVLLRIIIVDTVVWGDRAAGSAGIQWSGARQDSGDLVKKISNEVVAASRQPYNLTRPSNRDFSQNGQSCYIASLFEPQSESRTFLEAGAYNGEELSNTLYLERDLGWTGLLVEPDPWSFWALTRRNRRARLLQACLSPTTSASMMTLKQSGAMSRLRRGDEVGQRGIFTEVPCYPLYAVMRATRLTTLDYLALDLEGMEMQVLQTLPWDRVNITVIQVEASHLNSEKTASTSRKKPTKNFKQPRTTTMVRQRALYLPQSKSENIRKVSKSPMIGQLKQAVEEEDTFYRDCLKETTTVLPKIEELSSSQKRLVMFMAKHQYEFIASIGEDFIFKKLQKMPSL